jgi:hypothetical protein
MLHRTPVPSAKNTVGVHEYEIPGQGFASTYSVDNVFSLFKRGIVGITTKAATITWTGIWVSFAGATTAGRCSRECLTWFWRI